MSPDYSEHETTLRQQVRRSKDVLQELQDQLRDADARLEALAQEKRRYDVLSQAVHSLEELAGLDAAHLFWDVQDGREAVDRRLDGARRKIDEFSQQVVRAEAHRQSIIDKIEARNADLDDLYYDLQQAIDQEQRRRNNWVIEREPNKLPYRDLVMPWSRGFEEDRRFRRSMIASLLASSALALLISSIALPIVERTDTPELPERVAKLVREHRIQPPPPPPAQPVEEPVVAKEDLPEPEPIPVEDLPPEPVDKPVLAEIEQPEQTRAQVESKGILAFRDSFAARADLGPSAQLGSRARLSNAGTNAVGRPQRSMVTTSAPGSSGGINLADISRDVGGGGGGNAIEGVQVTRVASSIGGGDGPDRPLSGGSSAGRTDEEIQIVFDRYKAALYRLYNRELRKNPTLRGQIVLRLTIEPDGSVSLCQLQSSDMNAPALAQQVVDRVLTFDFGAKQDIVAMTIIYPIDFLPAA